MCSCVCACTCLPELLVFVHMVCLVCMRTSHAYACVNVCAYTCLSALPVCVVSVLSVCLFVLSVPCLFLSVLRLHRFVVC